MTVQEIKTKSKVHPRQNANFLSKLFFCWEIPVFYKSLKKGITEDDIYDTLKEHESKLLGDKLEKAWNDEITSYQKPSLTRALMRVFGLEILIVGLSMFPLLFIYQIFQPVLLMHLLDFFASEENGVTKQEAYVYGVGMILLSFGQVINFSPLTHILSVLGMKMRIACSSLIYRKSLKLKKSNLHTIRTGQIVNLITNDVNRFDVAFQWIHYLWIGPIAAIVSLYLLDTVLGHTAIAGFAIYFICFPLQIYLSKLIAKYRRNVASKTDVRVRLMNEILCGIQMIKMYTWEQPYENLVKIARNLEVNEITKATYCRFISSSFKIIATRLSLFCCILAAILIDFPLRAQYVYAVGIFYETMRSSLTILLPRSVISLSETMITVKRIEEFLLEGTHLHEKFSKRFDDVVGIYTDNITARWSSSVPHYNLKHVSFCVTPGELVAVVGTAGSGKSTLLQVIVKEIEILQGGLHVGGTVSYASQEPWIFSASIQQNILFGEEMDDKKYYEVIRVCAMEHDISLLPYGDRTIVGDRGVMLSGGQKARINLARAVYRNADIYLLDDPLSAVDAHVSKQIFEECIKGYLKNKIVVLVTHQLQYLKRMDKILVLEMGKIVASGSYDELEYLGGYFKTLSQVEEKTDSLIEKETAIRNFAAPTENKEQQSTGPTSIRVYKSYCCASRKWYLVVLLILLLLLIQLIANSADIFITFWVGVEEETAITLTNQNKTTYLEFFTTENNLLIYGILLVTLLVLTTLRCWAFSNFCMTSSKIIHDTMLTKVMYGTMRFFNVNSSGRIINRFSKDLGFIDENLPVASSETLLILLNIFGIGIIQCMINYWMIIPTIILFGMCYCYVYLCVTTNKIIIRIEAIRRSPIYSHMAASVQGLTTIRAFNNQNRLQEQFDDYQNQHTAAFYLYVTLRDSLNFWIDMIGALYAATLITFSLIGGTGTSPSEIGLTIMQSLSLVGLMSYGLRNWSDLDTHLTAVERIVEYTELTPETDDGAEEPPESWPFEGNIEFRAVSLQYSPEHAHALDRVTFKIKGGEKVGIVGRTGAGKSSLTSVLFRLYNFDGKIFIDGVDIKQIPLNDLRSKISIIPQEPVLFRGTLRKNLDPFYEYTDAEIWDALEEVRLKDVVFKRSSGLDSEISENGSNFSLGQRQLLCLVRAIVRRSKIIILDEATANIDFKTDELIQAAIRRRFKDSTVLTIAHRLQTVMDSDKILVLEGGFVMEFDHPYNLLQNSSGPFYGYIMRSGAEIAEDLIKIARNNFVSSCIK